MGMFINEQRMIEDNLFKYEHRLKSPVSRFIEQTPTFVTYYHLNNDSTTVDDGFKDISSLIGFRSPLRFNKIESFPLYGIEQIVLSLQEMDQGLDTSYESEAIIVPGSIKPLPNDFFIIPFLKDPYLFRVTEINYDTIMPDNYYKIGFKLEYLEDEKVENIQKQVKEKYTCILQNIGTENNCIIELESKDVLDKIDAMYDDMASTYKALFYNDRHNCFLGEIGPGMYLYDPFQTQFINEHQIFNKKNDLTCLMLTDQFTDSKRRIKYEKSIYRFVERRNPNLVNNFAYDTFLGMDNHETTFHRWMEKNIYILDIPSVLSNDATNIFSNEFVLAIKSNGFVNSKYAEFIKKYCRGKEEMTIHDIPLDLNDELLYLDGNMEVFFFTPIIMYMIQDIVNSFLKIKK